MVHPEDALKETTQALEVLSVRLPMLAMGCVCPTKEHHEEATRMVVEKMVANVEGALAVQQVWADTLFGAWYKTTPVDIMERSVEAYLEPARKTLRENAERLTQR